MLIPIILSIACELCVVFFLWSEFTWKRTRTFIIKGICSLMFVAVGISGYILNVAGREYGAWVIAALVLGLAGDLFLALPDTNRNFMLGLSTFLAGHLVYGIVFAMYNGFLVWDILIYVFIIGMGALMHKAFGLKMEGMKYPAMIYMIIIAFMTTMAVSSAYKGGFDSVTSVLIAVGACLFAASDSVLAYERFRDNPKQYLRAVNLGLYYSGQVLLALSIATFK